MGKGKGLKPTPVKSTIGDRANGKARKKTPAKLAIRAKKRSGNVSEE